MTPVLGRSLHGPAGLVRPRLNDRLADPGAFRTALVAAPAGSGKSTLLAQVTASYPGPVARCPESPPRSEDAFDAWIWGALATSLGLPTSPSPGIEEIGAALGEGGEAILLVADDLHLLEGTAAEAALERLVTRPPDRLRLLLASRVQPRWDLSRLRVSGQLVEIDAEDLRFRTWEVEQLFRYVYENPLTPEETADLARRTDGWAACLQLFSLAAARKSRAERRRLLRDIGFRSREVREYLTHQVMEELPAELRHFLIRTSVLRRPTPPLCSELLGLTFAESAAALEELRRRQLCSEGFSEGRYCYHPLLLAYLDARLVEVLGTEGAQAEHRRAAALLERDSHVEDALFAYARAEDWHGIARLLGHPSASDWGSAWMEALPPTVVASDPWLLLAKAQRLLMRGSLRDALKTLREAERAAATQAVADRCRAAGEQVTVWLSADPPQGTDWAAVIRRATQREPVAARREAALLPGPSGRFAEAACAFLAELDGEAEALFRSVASDPSSSPALVTGAELFAFVAACSAGSRPGPEPLRHLREEATKAGFPWLERVTRAVAAVAEGAPPGMFTELTASCQRDGDPWGEAIVASLEGFACVAMGEPAMGSFAKAARLFSELGAGVAEAWLLSHLALAARLCGDHALAASAAEEARSLATLLEVPGAAKVAAAVSEELRKLPELPEGAPPDLPAYWPPLLAEGDRPPTQGQQSPTVALASPPAVLELPLSPIRLSCFGTFSLVIAGRRLDEAAAKSAERSLLRLLAIHAGEALHREVLVEALWPEAEPEAGLHRLQVAVSSLRKLLDDHEQGAAALVVRNGASYRLALPEDAVCDILELERNERAARRHAAAGDVSRQEKALRSALAAYRGPLVPDAGPAEWVLRKREALQALAAGAAASLASLLLEEGDPEGAAAAAEAGIAIDRYRDELWRLRIEAGERAGWVAEVMRSRRDYEAVLEELGA